jgi:RimJ/RimL family protein N-acetyltransferase
MEMRHAADLLSAGQDPDIWAYMAARPDHSLEAMQAWISTALHAQALGTELPFVIVHLATNTVVGSTRYMTITPEHRGLEIGWTWLGPAARRTAVNTECKYLLLQHAFEVHGAIRVQLKTHHQNFRSQNAIARLGAVREGVLRNHIIMPDGSYRHSVYFSILASEWPQVKSNLEAKLRP